MERSSQLILRSETRLPPGPLLLVNPPRDMLYRQLRTDERIVQISTQDYGDYRWLSGSGAGVSFDVLPRPFDSLRSVILHLPREKGRLVMMLHSIASWLPSEAQLWLVGENKAGIKSAPRYLKQFFQTCIKLDSARHCVLLEASGAIKERPFQTDDYARTWPVVFSRHRIEAVSLPGVFAHGRLDKGSELLLLTLEEQQPAGSILDFACGSGAIGCALMAADARTELTLLDVSALALEASRQTLNLNGLEAALLPSAGLSELSQRFDWIVSNPPFHRGVSNDLEVAADFFSAAGTFLTENGRIVIVCNRHLPYSNWLQNHFETVERLAMNKEFMIIQASKPRKRKE